MKEGITEPDEDFFDEFGTNFYLNYSQKLKLRFLFKDSKIIEFYRNFLRDGIFPSMKGAEMGQLQMELLGTFAIFELDHDFPDSNFIDIAPAVFTPLYLRKNSTPESSPKHQYKLFDKV